MRKGESAPSTKQPMMSKTHRDARTMNTTEVTKISSIVFGSVKCGERREEREEEGGRERRRRRVVRIMDEAMRMTKDEFACGQRR